MNAGLDFAKEGWTPRQFPNLAGPGQLFPDERYTERFAAVEAELQNAFKGVTTDGNVLAGLFPLAVTGVPTAPIRLAATTYLAGLNPSQRARAVFPIDASEWRRWHGLFTRLMRHGICLEEMTPTQKRAAIGLVRATLSVKGFAAIEAIRLTNQLAGELTGRFRDLGDDVYWLSIMGHPASDGPWGWQLDGHHININCLCLGDQLVLTPAYLGAEPTRIKSGKLAGLRLFEAEESNALNLMTALTPAQRAQATIAGELSMEVLGGAFRDNFELRYEGAAVRDFTEEQRRLAVKLIEDYVGHVRPGHAEARLAEIERHLEDTYFAWIGGFEGEEAFYYRVHSPVILIEFNHLPGISLRGDRPSRNHIHTVVRTPNGNDYGKDLLRQHLERSHFSQADQTLREQRPRA